MYKAVTLNQLIAELQKLAEENGEKRVVSIGSSCGKIQGMNSPFTIRFEGEFNTHAVAAWEHDIKAKEAAQ